MFEKRFHYLLVVILNFFVITVLSGKSITIDFSSIFDKSEYPFSMPSKQTLSQPPLSLVKNTPPSTTKMPLPNTPVIPAPPITPPPPIQRNPQTFFCSASCRYTYKEAFVEGIKTPASVETDPQNPKIFYDYSKKNAEIRAQIYFEDLCQSACMSGPSVSYGLIRCETLNVRC